jgi:hypothetical protein
MRVLMGSAIAAVVAVTGLFGAIAQTTVVSHYANSSTAAQVADVKTGLLLAARQGGPAVYGSLYVRPTGDNNELSLTRR